MARKRKKNPYAGIGSTLTGAGAAAAGAGGKRHSRRKQSHANVGAALGGVGSSASAAGHGFKHAAKHERNRAVSAVTKYAAGSKGAKPTIAQVTTAWPHLPEDVRKFVAPAIIQRAWSESDPTASGISLKTHATKPLPKVLRKYAPEAFDAYNQRLESVKQGPINAGDPPIPGGSIIRGAVSLGEAGATAARATSAATKTGETVAAGEKAAKTESVAARVGEGTTKVTSRAGRTTEAVRASRAGRATKTVTEAAGKAASSKPGRAAITTAKIGSAPVRKPITRGFPLYLGGSAAVAAVNGENVPDAVKNAASLNPSGKAKEIIDAVGNKLDDAGFVGNVVKDTLELPAAVVPSTVLLGAAAVKAIGGDPKPLKDMWTQYKDTGAIPALVSGDFNQLADALSQHPVYSGLELAGGGAALSRGAGGVLRSGALGEAGKRIGSTERTPLELVTGETRPRTYSKGMVRKYSPFVGEKARDRARQRRTGGQKAGGRETNRILAGGKLKSGEVDRINGVANEVQRFGKSDVMRAVDEVMPRGRGKRAEANRNGVVLAKTIGIPERGAFKETLQLYRQKVIAVGEELRARADDTSLPKDERSVAKADLKINQNFVALLDNVIKYGDPATIIEASIQLTPKMKALQDELAASNVGLDPYQAERATLIPAGRVHLDLGYGIPKDKLAEWEQAQAEGKNVARPASEVLDREGNPITNEAIKQGLRKKGVNPDELGFISQRPITRGDFYRPWWNSEQSVRKAIRTGAATTRGWDIGAETLIASMVRARGIIDAAKTFRHSLDYFGAKVGDSTRIFKSDTAMRAVADPAAFDLTDKIAWRAVRINRSSKNGLSMDEATGYAPDAEGIRMQQADMWGAANAGGPGDYVLIPEAVAKRLDQHFAHAGSFEKSIGMLNQAFKGTVLPYSPKWLASNFVDVNMRAMIAGQPPIQRITSLNMRFAKQMLDLLDEVDSEAGARMRAQVGGGTHYGSVLNTRIHGRFEDFTRETGKFGQALWWARNRPTIDNIINAHTRASQAIFELNRALTEEPGNLAIFGKLLKEEAINKGFMHKWNNVLRLDEAARRDLAQGLLHTENQIAYAKGVQRVMGQWEGNSPFMRQFLTSYAPFGMWTRAATSFVFKTLPVDHPILTAIIASSELMTQKEREALGFTVFTDRPLPDYLRAGLPDVGIGLRGGVSGMTSFGFFADPGKALSGTILPQFSGPLMRLSGLDWTGQRLEDANGFPADQGSRIAAAFSSGAETFFPLLAIYDRISALQGANDAPDAAGDLLLGKDTAPEYIDWLRDQAISKQTTYIPSDSSSSSSSSSTSSSSSGTSLPPWWGSSSSSSSSSSGSTLPPWWK